MKKLIWLITLALPAFICSISAEANKGEDGDEKKSDGENDLCADSSEVDSINIQPEELVEETIDNLQSEEPAEETIDDLQPEELSEDTAEESHPEGFSTEEFGTELDSELSEAEKQLAKSLNTTRTFLIATIAVLVLISSVLLALLLPRGGVVADPPEEPQVSEPDIIVVEPAQPPPEFLDDHVHGIDFDQALATFSPETVMIRANGLTFTWAEFYVLLYSAVRHISQMFPEGIDWAQEFDFDGSLPELVLEQATEDALTFLAYAYGARSLGAVVDEDLLRSDLDSLIEMYGSMEELEAALRERGGFYSFDVYERLARIDFAVVAIMDELYGPEFASVSDEFAADYVERNGYMMAMHILRMKDGDDDDDTSLQEIEAVLAELNEHTDDDDFESIFQELMFVHSEDFGGVMSFPDGYLFLSHEMVTSFSEASSELEYGELSGIVESEFGYHIILRLPVDYDFVPYSLESAGRNITLRQLAGFEDFEARLQEWRNSMDIEFTPEYNSIDIATIFAWCVH